MAFVAMRWFPGDGEAGGCFVYSQQMISAVQCSYRAPLWGPDSQTWTSNCEPSVRCVQSQRGGRTPITAALSRHWFSLSAPWSHACLSATCLPLPLISAQSASSSCLVSSPRLYKRQTDTHQQGSCVSSYLDDACRWVRRTKKIGQCFHVGLKPRSRAWPGFFCGVPTGSFSTKALVEKKVRNLSCCKPLSSYLSLHWLSLSLENSRTWVEGFLFPFLLHNPLHGFSSAVQHIRTNISLQAFISYETGRTIMSY